MWYWIIKVSILSLILIYLLHYLYSFFVSTLTIPKVKDLVTIPQEKYNEMFLSLHQEHKEQQQMQPFQRNSNSTTNNSNTISNQSMKEDLIHFLKDLGSDTSPSCDYSLNENSKPMSFNTLLESYNSNISSFSFSK
jgi:hypothetical protein